MKIEANQRVGIATWVLISIVRAYQILISPFLPPRCRFEPSCSRYTVAALERHGALRGTLMAIGRVLRCHPLHDGGFDPVP
jgi:putative membrane protein insertion efficiency factor